MEIFIQLRVTHPLGEYIISRALETPVPDASIEFEVDNLSSRQVLLEKYKGKSGVAVVYKVKAYNELDSHEHLLFCSKLMMERIFHQIFLKNCLKQTLLMNRNGLETMLKSS